MQNTQSVNQTNISRTIDHSKAIPVYDKKEIVGFKVFRSQTNKLLFNVVGVNSKDKQLAVAAIDLLFNDAASMVESLNDSFNQDESTKK